MQFNEILATLPNINHLAAIELFDGENLVARIDNKPGSAGSVRVYHALNLEFGTINASAAVKGLEIYAEHSQDAVTFPGKHPNIDRLLSLVQQNSSGDAGKELAVKLIAG